MAEKIYTLEELTKMANENREGMMRMLGVIDRIIKSMTIDDAEVDKIMQVIKELGPLLIRSREG